MAEVRRIRGPEEESYAAEMFRSIVKASAVFAVFSLFVLGMLLVNDAGLRGSDPRSSRVLKTLKADLHRHPRDEKIKSRIREVDISLRREYLRRLDFGRTGDYLLLIGIASLLICLPAAAHYRKKIVLPEKESDADGQRLAALGRRSVAVFGAIAVGGFVYLTVSSRGSLTAGYMKAVREYEKNPQGVGQGGGIPRNPLLGLSPAMLQNMAGRLPVAAVPAGGIPPTAVPNVVGLPTGPIPVLPVGTTGPALGALLPLNPLAGRTQPQTAGLGPEAPFDDSDYSPSAEEFAANWPVFRGPASGDASGGFPAKWNGASGEGIVWKSQVSLPGWNSPVVWQSRVFLTGADKKSRAIFCFNGDNGKLLWKESVQPLVKGNAPDVFDDTGYAASTAATDGKRVFAIFPNGDIFAYSFEGKRLWGRNLGVPDIQYGYASSLATFRSLLIVQYDQGSEGDGKSAMLALQAATGKIVWMTKRPVGGSWASPVVVRSGDSGIVLTNANPWAIGYDALLGRELWRANVMSGDVAPSPTHAGGMSYVCNNGAVLAAIKAGGSGDITKTHVSWQASDGLPDITSPATDGNLLFLISTEGMATCYDARDGKKVWEHSFDVPFKSSPVIADGRVYLLDGDGVTHIIDAKPTFREDGKSSIGEKTNATPAFVGGRIYIRGEKHLFCIGAK